MHPRIFSALLIGIAALWSAAPSPASAQIIAPASNNNVGVPTNQVQGGGTFAQSFAVYNPTTRRYVTLTINIKVPGKMQNETNVQASQRKADAIATAMNASITAAIAAGTLPAGTAMITVGAAPAQIGATDRFGRPINAFGNVIVPGAVNPLFQGPQAMVANPIAGYGVVQFPGGTILVQANTNRDTTGEPRSFAPIGNAPAPNGNNMPGSGSMGGPGSSSGRSSGMSYSGGQSEISFGLMLPQGLNAGCSVFSGAADPTDFADLSLPGASGCPGDYIATIDPTAGEDDLQVLSQLAALFNTEFSSDGLSATYDPGQDLITLDNPIYGPDALYINNTDTGLDFSGQIAYTPEPATMALLGAGLAGLGLLRRRKGQSVEKQ